jgi:ubiquinone/menaquinone biosynthesis C-methylase UbiE
MTYKGKGKSNVYDSKEGYDLYANQYDKKLDFLHSFESDILLRMFKNFHGKSVLDVGCGTGRLIRLLKDRGAVITGADVSDEMIKIAGKKFPDVGVVSADIEDLPFKDKSFDVVVAAFVIVHLGSLQGAFDEAYRVLKDGGIFILTNINQKKAPKLKTDMEKDIIIKSYYHRPEDVTVALANSLFVIKTEEFVNEDGVWINQIISAEK